MCINYEAYIQCLVFGTLSVTATTLFKEAQKFCRTEIQLSGKVTLKKKPFSRIAVNTLIKV